MLTVDARVLQRTQRKELNMRCACCARNGIAVHKAHTPPRSNELVLQIHRLGNHSTHQVQRCQQDLQAAQSTAHTLGLRPAYTYITLDTTPDKGRTLL